MKIWDRGTYEVHKFRDDEVMVTFHGERVRGRYVLFRTRGDDWMIHRMDPPEDPDREPMPEQLEPMLARTGELPADDGRWAFEIKWDGVRAIAFVQGGRLLLQARSGRDITAALPRAARRWPRRSRAARWCSTARSSRSTARRPSFQKLQGRMHLTSEHADPAARARRPGALRRRSTCSTSTGARCGPALRGAPRAAGRARAAAARPGRRPRTTSATAPRCSTLTRAQELEGVVAKRLDSPYLPGPAHVGLDQGQERRHAPTS